MARPKGSKNERTEQWELFAEYMLIEGLQKFKEEANKLEGKQYCDVILNAMEFHRPRLSRVSGDPDSPQQVEIIIKNGTGNTTV